MNKAWSGIKRGFVRGVRDFVLWIGLAFGLFGLAATLGVMFRIFKWVAGL